MIIKYFHNYKNIEKEKIKLKEDEYLVHLRVVETRSSTREEFKIFEATAFYTILSGKKIPKSWLKWREQNKIYDFKTIKYETFIWKETFREGFKIHGYRMGKSQSWVKVKTPEGWEFEISLPTFLNFLDKNKIIIDNGKLLGKYKIKVLNAKSEIELVKE